MLCNKDYYCRIWTVRGLILFFEQFFNYIFSSNRENQFHFGACITGGHAVSVERVLFSLPGNGAYCRR